MAATSPPATCVLVAVSAMVLAACNADGKAPAVHAESGHATGMVVDTRGNPVPGARILLDNTVYYASYINGSSGRDGRYRIALQPGSWQAHASFKKEFQGRTFALRLHPDNIDSFDESGAVRNFTWKLEGREPENDFGYYGGLVKVFTGDDFHEDMDDVELTLAPVGPLIDGSQGETLVLRQGGRYWARHGHLEDIPIGRYRASARLLGEAGPRPLRIRDWHSEGGFQPQLPFDFLPETGGGTGASASIVVGY